MGRPRPSIVPLDAGPVPAETAPPLSLVQPEPEPAAPAAPARTSARQKLADAIETVRALEAEIAEASAAVSEAEQHRWKTADALSDAEAELERAKPRPASGLFRPREPHTFRSQEEADAYHALLNTPPPPIEDAKTAVASATDARDSAVAALQFHQKRLDTAANRLRWKRSEIDEALRLAVHYDPAMEALAAETKRLATAAAAARQAFEMAVGTSLMQPNHVFYDSTKPTDFRTDPKGWAIVHRWREALEQLATDPDAVLPMPASV